MLVPAGFLVLMLLAALSVDSATAYLGHRQLDDAITAAANDAATAGLSNAAYYDGGTVVLAPSATAEAVCRSLAAQGMSGLENLQVEVGTSGPEVTVVARADVKAVFGVFVRGFGTRAVSAEVSADARQSPLPPDTPPPVPVPVNC